MKKIARYWHTLRYLRPVQFYGRLWFRFVRPTADIRSAPALRTGVGAWASPARREPSLLDEGRFVFLSEEGALSEVGWDGPAREKLWRYNQHYFDDLNALGTGQRVAWHRHLLADWVARNPVGEGNAWEPYPLSLRIVNWVKWAQAGNPLPAQCVQSLAVQARWLTKRLEIHLLGNHLFANAKALVFAGLFFQGEEAEAWLHKGLAIIARELPEQILADGGHFERSTMYHALAFEDMLDLCNIAQVYAPTRHAQIKGWREVARKMRGWLTAMCHPDGEIGLFNDAALGIAPSVAELLGYADRLALAGPQVQAAQFRHLASSGYVRLEAPDMLALLDVAPIGPDYLPGHAHADTLTFECSFHGQRVFVNSGTSCYGISAERLRQRGTAAHNTVVVDGENSSEVWGGFRVARRARPLSLKISHENGDRIACSHDGYRRLPGQPVHRRTWFVNGQLRIEDAVSGRFGHAQARFHLHPDVKVQLVAGGSTVSLALPDGHEIRCEVERGVASLEPSTYHPRFGVSQATHCLVVELVDGLSVVRIDWN